MTINQTILKKLLNAKTQLSDEAANLIRSFLLSKMRADGGFIDRSGASDPYYSVFGYTLSYVFDSELNIEKEKEFLLKWQAQNRVDFVHAVSLVRCYYLLEAIEWVNSFGKISKSLAQSIFFQNLFGRQIARKLRKEHKGLLQIITSYKSKNNGFNHLNENPEYSSVYANFLAYGLFEDLYFSKNWQKAVAESSNQLKLKNGSFVNHPKSKQGVSSTTAAGIILLYNSSYSIFDSTKWLKEQIQSHGGFLAGEDVPVADVLSTATSLLALEMTETATKEEKTKAVEFVNLHWNDSGGFFGSIADQIADVEYTFYGLLAVGC